MVGESAIRNVLSFCYCGENRVAFNKSGRLTRPGSLSLKPRVESSVDNSISLKSAVDVVARVALQVELRCRVDIM